MRFPLIILPLLALVGCGGTPITIPNPFAGGAANLPATITLTGNPLADAAPIATKLSSYTMADVQQANALALGAGDAKGSLCWTTVQSVLPNVNPPTGAGAAVAIQMARNLQKKVPDLVDVCGSILPIGIIP